MAQATPLPEGRADGTGSFDAVILALPTPVGLRGKLLSPNAYRRALADGCEMSAYNVATDADMQPDEGFPWLGSGTGDLVAKPDQSAAFTAVWHPGAALVLADACNTDGSPVPHAPRQVLRTQLARLAEAGLTAVLGVESEAHAYTAGHRRLHADGYRDLDRYLAADFNTDYVLEYPSGLTTLLHRLYGDLTACGLPVEAVKTEASPGQVEITFEPAEPMVACDRHAVFKTAARQSAEAEGMALSFMAQPHAQLSGSGCHLHLSLWDEDGRNVFAAADGADGEAGGGGTRTEMSPRIQHALGGALELLAQASLLYMPTVNSYKRLGRTVFTPTRMGWGHDDRTKALRLVGRGDNRRIEFRLPGADCQPHLAAAALVAGLVHGIREQVPLPDTGYAGAEIPRALHEAIAVFEQDPVLPDALGKEVVEHYAHAGRLELETFQRAVSDWELERGLSRA
ncbi:MAG TPA: glutamine synthetase family protein [Actinocrinis sp.]|jgi:glutamine synthetase